MWLPQISLHIPGALQPHFRPLPPAEDELLTQVVTENETPSGAKEQGGVYPSVTGPPLPKAAAFSMVALGRPQAGFLGCQQVQHPRSCINQLARGKLLLGLDRCAQWIL